jgi:hypothetical protein
VIVEALIGGVTAIVLGSLWLARRVLEMDAESADPGVWIEPYVFPSEVVKCPVCGVAKSMGQPEYGPRMPVACSEGAKCPAYPVVHLHVSCGYCKASWFRHALTAGKKR